MTEANGPGEGGNAGGSTTAQTDSTWTTGLSSDNAAVVEAKQWSDPNSMIDSYRALEQRQGGMVAIPGADATPEEVTAYREKIGVPKEAGGYELANPEGFPENGFVDTELWDRAKVAAHKAGIPAAAMQELYADMMNFGVERQASYETEHTDRMNAATDALASKWGPADGDLFKRNVELTDRSIRELGGDELRQALVESGVLTAEGAVLNVPVVEALQKVGASLFAEDSLYGGVSADRNPFKAETLDLTEQGRILKSNPQHARTLIQLAGLKPADYGLAA